jgi:uncharacterized membrane protein HdeD (DUF308 family)
MPTALAAVLGVALGLYLINRPAVGAWLGGMMLPAGTCDGCKGA